RADPTQEELDLFAGTSLAPAGRIIQVLDPFFNLDSRISKGWDFGMSYNVPDFGVGKFRLRFNAARLESIVQNAGADGQEILDAIDSGVLPLDVAVEGLGQLLEIEGRPKWRFSSSINWDNGPLDIGLFGRYVGKVWDTSVIRDVLIESDDPNANFFRVDSFFTVNFSIAYTINNDTALDGTRLRFAINNLFDEDPPLADENFGFFSELHSPRGRQFAVQVRKTF
ncbi:MAG: TonB-dependent receptor, partial [Erythrobacter sp.]|nr:TonB-dependent receptor [Erythrobacter sp.]